MPEDLAEEARALAPWFHNLQLPDGTRTAPGHPLGDFPASKWRRCQRLLPEDLTGRTVLDIGTNGGFYAIECARRGAQVTALDLDRRYLRQARWASEVFGVSDRIELVHAQVYDMAEWDRTFDIVLFLGVFYHLRYPLLGLDIVAHRAKDLCLFQSLTMPGPSGAAPKEDHTIHETRLLTDKDWPAMAFIEGKWAGDKTNWWVPNPNGVEAMLRSAGFDLLDREGDTLLARRSKVPPATDTWDQSEYLSATGRPWQRLEEEKTRPRLGTIENPV